MFIEQPHQERQFQNWLEELINTLYPYMPANNSDIQIQELKETLFEYYQHVIPDVIGELDDNPGQTVGFSDESQGRVLVMMIYMRSLGNYDVSPVYQENFENGEVLWTCMVRV